MYTYKLLKDDKSINIIKKANKGAIIPVILRMLCIVDIVILILWYMFEDLVKLRGYEKFYIFIMIIVVQFIIFKTYYNKIFNKELAEYKEQSSIVSFSQEGIEISKRDSLKQIKWSGVREIRVYEEYLLFIYNVNGITSNVFLFDGFEVEKDEIICEIRKYKDIRG